MSKMTTKEHLKSALLRVVVLIGDLAAATDTDMDRLRAELTGHSGNKSNPHGVTADQVGAAASSHTHSGYVPTSRRVNGKDLSADISLTATDVGAAASSHGTHVTFNSAAPKMDGTAATGTASTVARSDHVHPTDTSRAAASHTHTAADVGAAASNHTHTPADIGAAAASHGTHVSYSATVPKMDGTAATGTASTVARSDHVHPTDTSRAAASHTHSKSQITDFPTSLPASDVHDWAKAATKPTYTASEVGAAASSHTHSYAGSSTAGGVATSAAKLSAARTITLSGDVTGSVSFDGSANKTMSAALADSGVTAGTYGPFLNGICWMANNSGVKTSTATWTLTAKRAGVFRFLYAGGGEENYDYLTVTVNGNEILTTKGVNSPYGGYFETTLAVGDVVVFNHIEDGSNFYDGDYAGIGNLVLGNTNTQFEAITPENISTYFTVSNGTYTFTPKVVFTGGMVKVDSKGRVIVAKNIYPVIYPLDVWKRTVGVQSKSLRGSVTIPTSGWNSDSTETYPKYYDIAVTGVTTSDRANIDIALASMSAAVACGLCPVTETLAGKIRIRAANVPAAAMTANYWIEKGA